jgi:predicted double-glycine peptidase
MPRLILILCLSLLVGGCSVLPNAAFWEQGTPALLRHTVKDLRDQYLVKQQEDYSCGAAALATLMIYYFGEDTSEKEILNLLEGSLTEEEKKTKTLKGFSLLDLKRVANTKGYQAAGFRLKPSQLAQLTAPVLVFVEPLGYKHFAVFRGMNGDRVYLADPSRGNLRMSLNRFLDEWGRIVFVLGRPDEKDIQAHPLEVPHPWYVQPELARFNGLLDIGMMTRALPQR